MHPSSVSLAGLTDFQECLFDSELADLSYRGCLYTWTNKSPSNPKARKLDRALINEAWQNSYPDSNAYFDVPGSSDHSPCLVTISNSPSRRKSRFNFFNFFTTHPDYGKVLQIAWQGPTFLATPMATLYQKLRAAKLCCKSLNQSTFSNIQARTKEAFEKLESVQMQVMQNPTQTLFMEEQLARDSWLLLASAEESFFRQKSRIRWVMEGDANTGYFHKSVKANLSRNIIHFLRDDSNQRISDPLQIRSMVISFYSQLLGRANTFVRPYSISQIQQIHPFRCDSLLSEKLSAIPSNEEIRATVFALPRNKAPGPDGFTVEFFTSSWDLVGGDLIKAVVGAATLSEFRPISLCNTVYKVISRILAARLKCATPEAVQRNQVGFISGRLLCENVLLASELVNDFHKPGPTTRGCLQIDITKAYDSVDWDFVLNILEALQFPAIFISWIKLCITSPYYSIVLNGELVGFFPGKKGLRQGDPLSSSLFVLVMDILSKELDLALTKDVFRPHPLCHDPLVTHLSFADDVLIFFDGSERSLNGILHTLTLFHQTSGLGLNLQKSCLFLDGNNSDFASDLATRHGLLQGSLPVRYLGLPLMPHKLGPQDYQVLLDKVLARLSSWTTRHLSFAGRLQLIQSVIYSIINFWASVFPLPQGCLDALGKICNAFLWSGAPNSARGAKVAWESVCTPKKEGGLGIRNLNGLNQVFGLKLIWLLFAGNGSLWVAWIEKVILNGKHFWSHDFQRTGSWIWRRLMKLRSLARPFLSCQVRSGSSAFFWHDDWTNLGPLIDITGPNGPRVSGIPSLAKVSHSCANDSWLIPRGRHPILCLLRQCLPQQVPVFSQESDFFLWRNIPNAPPSVFSTSKTWTTLHPPGPPVSWFKSVWFKERIPKHAFMLWIAIRDRLTTRDRLRSWGMNVPSDCLLCTSSAENRSHLFFECVYSNEVWSSFFTHPDLSPPPLFEDIVVWVRSSFRCKKLQFICKLIFQAVVYGLWKERNSRLHSGVLKPAAILVKEIQLSIRAKLLGLDRRQHKFSNASSTTPIATESFLLTWFRFIQR